METSSFIIYSKDVQVITGRSLRQSQRILEATRKNFNKKKGHLVTLSEFCSYCEFKEDEVMKIVRGR